ncbi:MAG: hypothetical protein INR63_17920 [Actinomycetospora chiangmaiensis]|nr:hypothetical protein [Actinomycetospora chiangmaiensis]
MSATALKSLREDVEAAVTEEAVDGHLGRGVYAYVGALVRLVEDGDRAPAVALAEAAAALGFLRSVSRLPDPRPRRWSPSCPE